MSIRTAVCQAMRKKAHRSSWRSVTASDAQLCDHVVVSRCGLSPRCGFCGFLCCVSLLYRVSDKVSVFLKIFVLWSNNRSGFALIRMDFLICSTKNIKVKKKNLQNFTVSVNIPKVSAWRAVNNMCLMGGSEAHPCFLPLFCVSVAEIPRGGMQSNLPLFENGTSMIFFFF